MSYSGVATRYPVVAVPVTNKELKGLMLLW